MHPLRPSTGSITSALGVRPRHRVLVGCRAGEFLVATLIAFAFVVAATSHPVAADSRGAVALAESGSFLEFPTDPELDDAIERANANGIAFAWLDEDGSDDDAIDRADALLVELDASGARYQTVLVLLSGGYAASSFTYSESEYNPALDAAFEGFRDGAIARGLDAFVGSLEPTENTPDGTEASSGDGGGIGVGSILLGIAGLGGGFFLFRAWRGRRRESRHAQLDLDEDRAEIKEQLKSNADLVISLGDRVIVHDDPELIATYEEATQSYQEVSRRIDGAESAEEVDELDDRIDHAEWQFQSIAAQLDGQPIPPSPQEVEAAAAVEAANAAEEERRSAPTPRRDDGEVVTSPRTGRSYRRRGQRPQTGGGLGGVLGGGLGGILANIVLGGGLGGTSRRTQRRRGGFSGIDGGFGGGLGGGSNRRTSSGAGLGGGVLRRGGGASTRRRSRSSGGRKLGSRSRRSGGRKL